jgi:hypothetical protein
MSRRAFRGLLALVLLVCLFCPFMEPAFGFHDSVFSIGSDTESTLAVLILLFELVIALAGLFAFLLSDIEVKDRVAHQRHRRLTYDWILDILPCFSPPIPLRI